MSITPKQIAELEAKMALERATETVLNAARRMRDAADEMERYARRVNEKGSEPGYAKPSHVISWALNAAVSLTPNLRLDMFATRAAELATTEWKLVEFSTDK